LACPELGLEVWPAGNHEENFSTYVLFWQGIDSVILGWPNLEIPLNPGEVKLNWIGRHRWHNGYASWFSVEVQEQKIYMTADVDKNMLDMIFLTMDTLEVYERLNNLL
jgi:hypothetical protein